VVNKEPNAQSKNKIDLCNQATVKTTFISSE